MDLKQFYPHDPSPEILKAYERFVPKQLSRLLGMEDVTQISLGDQVEKSMTILFSDIRDFTRISESMSPRKTFRFINSYLSYMEPAIAHYHFKDIARASELLQMHLQTSPHDRPAQVYMERCMRYAETGAICFLTASQKPAQPPLGRPYPLGITGADDLVPGFLRFHQY